MAKKQKRSTSRGNSPKPTIVNAPSEGSERSSRRASSGVEFNPDYSDIIKGLKRIGILAGSFLVILIVLSFFLN